MKTVIVSFVAVIALLTIVPTLSWATSDDNGFLNGYNTGVPFGDTARKAGSVHIGPICIGQTEAWCSGFIIGFLDGLNLVKATGHSSSTTTTNKIIIHEFGGGNRKGGGNECGTGNSSKKCPIPPEPKPCKPGSPHCPPENNPPTIPGNQPPEHNPPTTPNQPPTDHNPPPTNPSPSPSPTKEKGNDNEAKSSDNDKGKSEPSQPSSLS